MLNFIKFAVATQPSMRLSQFFQSFYSEMKETGAKCRSVQIPVPFGEISGNWYGSRDVRPILFIHGFSDNSGTFDRLIPLLPTHGSYLAIDLPGHGLSSRIPNGMIYHLTDTTNIILRIMKVYKWSKVSLVGHSLGAIMCYMFAGMYPDKVDLFIALDALQPSYAKNANILEQQAYYLRRAIEADEANILNAPPTEYSYEDLVEKIHNIPAGPIPKDLCHHLLRRNIHESKTLPGKYFFKHDNRTRHPIIIEWSLETNALTAKYSKFPALFVKATDSFYYGDEEEFGQLTQVMKENNPHTRLVSVDGGHYVHLIDPERVSRVIQEFLEECGYFKKMIESKL